MCARNNRNGYQRRGCGGTGSRHDRGRGCFNQNRNGTPRPASPCANLGVCMRLNNHHPLVAFSTTSRTGRKALNRRVLLFHPHYYVVVIIVISRLHNQCRAPSQKDLLTLFGNFPTLGGIIAISAIM